MERFNLFQLLHKAMKAAMYDTAWKLQQADFTIVAEATEVLEKIDEVVLLLDIHTRKERAFVLPKIEAYEPAIVSCLEEEHQHLAQQATNLSHIIRQYSPEADLLETICTGRRISDQFIEFMVSHLRHFTKEADILTRVLERYYSENEITAMAREITESTPPWIQDFYAKWMIRGVNNGEASGWIRKIRSSMPSVVFETILSKAQQELPAARYNLVARRFTNSSVAIS